MFTCFLHLESGEFWLSLLDMSQVLHEWVYPWFPDMQQKPRKQVVVYLFAESMSRQLYTYIYLHPVSGAGVSGEWWQLVTVIHDEGDGLELCEWNSQGYDCNPINLLFWRFFCNLVHSHLLGDFHHRIRSVNHTWDQHGSTWILLDNFRYSALM